MINETRDTDFLYGLLTEGRFDMMYLPADVATWLCVDERPQPQRYAATFLGVEAKRYNKQIVKAGLLRSDHNVLILTVGENEFSVYPDGGYGLKGKAIPREELNKYLQRNTIVEPSLNEPQAGAMELGVGADEPEMTGEPLMSDFDFDFPNDGISLVDTF